MSNFAADLAKLNRRMDYYERNRGSVLRFATVVGIENGQVRVTLADGQNVVTAHLPILQKRVLKDKFICLPDIGEPVAVLFSGKGYEDGVCLGAVYSQNTPAPDIGEHFEYKKFEDGTTLLYDRKEHKLYADIKGDIDIKVTKNVTIEIEGNSDIKVMGSANIKVDKTATLEAKDSISIKSKVDISLNAPFIKLGGILTITDKDGNAGSGILKGTYTIKQGSLHVPDEKITTPLVDAGDVRAGIVDLRTHKHTGVMSGGSTTQKPIGG